MEEALFGQRGRIVVVDPARFTFLRFETILDLSRVSPRRAHVSASPNISGHFQT